MHQNYNQDCSWLLHDISDLPDVVEINLLPDMTLDQLLETLNRAVRNKKGLKYAVQSLRSIRAGIYR